MSLVDDITDRVRIAVGEDSGLGKSLKFDLKGAGFIHIDGGVVTNENKPADLTLTITPENLVAFGTGQLDPMGAIMSGKLKLSNMAVAMGLQAKMQALFAKMA